MARSLQGDTLARVIQCGPEHFQGDYRGYTLAFGGGPSTDVWWKGDFVETVYGPDSFDRALDKVDEWIIADDGR